MYYEGKTSNANFMNKDIIIDSGTSYNLIPRRDLYKFLTSLNKITGMSCYING